MKTRPTSEPDPHPVLRTDRRERNRIAALVFSGSPIVVFDLETSGLMRTGERFPWPWEIGAVRLETGKPPAELSLVLDWGAPIPDEANLTGIDPETPMREGIEPAAALTAVAAFFEGASLAGQRIAEFDVPVLRVAYETLLLEPPIALRRPALWFDTRAAAEGLWPETGIEGAPAGWSLGQVAAFLGIEPAEGDVAHRALADARLTTRVLLRLGGEGI